MNKTKITLLFATLLVVGCSKQTGQQTTQETETQPALSQVSNEMWIDVRSPEEFAAGHLEGAINIPHTEIGERIAAIVADKERPIKLYCRSGRRSGIAQKVLTDMGYTHLSNEGGYEEILRRAN